MADTIKAIAELIKAVLLGGGLVLVALLAWRIVPLLIGGSIPFRLAVGKMLSLDVRPARVVQEGAGGAGRSVLPAVKSVAHIPSDYLYLNHTTFLRENKQEEFKKRTGVDRPHYDLRVVLDSYYSDALERVSFVEYVLHEAFPEPIQRRFNRADRFVLKELAYGEFVLVARVFLKDEREPLILQRYLTLWPSGPRI